jgi:hypothetical protein
MPITSSSLGYSSPSSLLHVCQEHCILHSLHGHIIHVQLACTLIPFASLSAPLNCYYHWLQISVTYSRLAWPAYACSYDFAGLCTLSLFICALSGWLSLTISGGRWPLARWPWLGRIPLRGPVGPVPGFDRVRVLRPQS